jgi:hypothetical protein
MPSPIGHSLAGMAAGWAIAGHPFASDARARESFAKDATNRPRRLSGRAAEALLFGAVAVAPDLDLLAGSHSTYTHSVGATLIVLVVARLLLGPGHWRLVLAIAGAYASHVLLDWLGSDTSPPIGIMALWPFTSGYYQSSLNLFDAISRRYWLPAEFIVGNLKAAIKEIVILGPFAWLANWYTGKGAPRARPN